MSSISNGQQLGPMRQTDWIDRVLLAVKEVGFPIVITGYLLFRLDAQVQTIILLITRHIGG